MENKQTNKIMSPPIIHMTMDHDKFKILKYNRPINHLTKMSKSLELANKLYVHPIIVNKSMEIIDGQHRWSYAKETQQPIYYVIDENFQPSDLIAHNVTASNWLAKDYAHFYSTFHSEDFPEEQRSNYALCIQICDEFKVSFDIFNKLFHISRGKASASAEFKSGKLQFRISKTEIFDVMLQLEEINAYILKFKLIKKVSLEVYYAFYHLIRLEGYDKIKMFRKMDENLDEILNILKFRTSEEMFSRLLDVYNKGCKLRLGNKK